MGFVFTIFCTGSVDDIENNGYNFTDGCGEMSLDVAQKVVENLSLKTYQTLNQKHKVGTDPVNLRAALRILSLGGGSATLIASSAKQS